jgi:hypothetical protein
MTRFNGLPVAGGLALMAALSACSSTSVDNTDRAEYNAAAEAYNDLRDQFLATPVDTAVPQSGVASYSGAAVMIMNTDPFTSSVSDTSLVGNADITADFGGDDLFGKINNVTGFVDNGEVVDFTGQLNINNGNLPGIGSSIFTADINGLLTEEGGGDQVSVAGDLSGNFRGPSTILPSGGLTASTVASQTDLRLNGVEYTGILSVVAERD